MSNAKTNVLAMFRGQIPTIKRGNAINRVQKILQANHITGLPSHWPKIYYGQTRANVNATRLYQNADVATLPDGAYLYLIEFKDGKYYKQFVRILNKLESGSRHFQLPTLKPGRKIVAAGELVKQGGTVRFNLESGTYTMELMKMTNTYLNRSHYISLVKNAFRNVNAINTKNILVPNIAGTLQELLARGNLSFVYGNKNAQPNPRVLAELKKAGLSNMSARNLISQLMNKNITPR